MQDPSAREQSAMTQLLESHHLTEESIRPDGNCLYSAFASQLRRFGSQQVFKPLGSSSHGQVDSKALRTTTASYIRLHKEDFEPFLFADDHSSAHDIDQYCKEIEETALWGGEMEITALSRALGMGVEIYSDRSLLPLVIKPDRLGKTSTNDPERVVRLAYYQHLYGLGQHYNALYKA
jgi:OTU domain-containing protein 6